jgi:hypothetical protein
MSVRAKFHCHYIQPNQDDSKTVFMNAVYHHDDPDHENSKFSDATPNGNFTMTIKATGPHAFSEPGKDYYLDFTPAS